MPEMDGLNFIMDIGPIMSDLRDHWLQMKRGRRGSRTARRATATTTRGLRVTGRIKRPLRIAQAAANCSPLCRAWGKTPHRRQQQRVTSKGTSCWSCATRVGQRDGLRGVRAAAGLASSQNQGGHRERATLWLQHTPSHVCAARPAASR